MSLRFIPGFGRLYCSDRYMAFFSRPDDELAGLVIEEGIDHHDLFRNLGSAVIKSGFKLPPFVVVALGDEPQIFAYGDIRLAGGAQRNPIKSNSAFTWVERSLTLDEISLLTIDSDSIEAFEAHADCHLESGMIPAGNFMWSGSEAQPETDSPEEAAATEENTTQEDAPVAARLGTADVEQSSLLQTRRIGEPAIAATTAAQVAARAGGSEPTGPFRSLLDGPASIDEGDETVAFHPDFDDSDFGDSDFGDSDFGDSDFGDDTEAAEIPAGRTVLENESDLPVETADQEGEGPPIGRLEMDDGQTIDITRSVYVGRYPSKFGLPPGYGSVVVASEHVSRIHWELMRDGDRVSVADLGSTTGTAIMRPGDAEPLPLAAGHVVAIEDGTMISFGDRTVRFVDLRGS